MHFTRTSGAGTVPVIRDMAYFLFGIGQVVSLNWIYGGCLNLQESQVVVVVRAFNTSTQEAEAGRAP